MQKFWPLSALPIGIGCPAAGYHSLGSCNLSASRFRVRINPIFSFCQPRIVSFGPLGSAKPFGLLGFGKLLECKLFGLHGHVGSRRGIFWGLRSSVTEDGQVAADRNGRAREAIADETQFSGDDGETGASEVTRVMGDLNRDGGSFLKSAQLLDVVSDKPEICTADELHYVGVPGTDWRLALWRYPARPQGPRRNHPLLLLSGIGTNAIGFDLDPSVSLARFMSEAGFDTWILEVRGAGLSKRRGELPACQISNNNGALSEVDARLTAENVKSQSNTDNIIESHGSLGWDSLNMATTLSNNISKLSDGLKNLLNEGQSQILSAGMVEWISRILEDFQLSERYTEFRERLTHLLKERQNSVVAMQLADLSRRLVKLLENGQRSVSPQFHDFQERLISLIDDFQKMLDMAIKYDWDFENYLEEDIPAAIDYILSESKPKDGKLHALGHSMGGIILYALLASHGGNSQLATAVTLASALDYGVSNSSLKLLLPLVDPVQALSVPAVPLGTLMATIFPLASRPPYVLAWLNSQVSAQDMMEPELFQKLVLNNFCTVPAELLLQLTTVFQPGGLRNRLGTTVYKENVWKCKIPVLAVAGDEDLVCPPAAVLDTVKAFPQDLIMYRLFGQDNLHYGHYDLVCGRMANQEIYPCIEAFFEHNDDLKVQDE